MVTKAEIDAQDKDYQEKKRVWGTARALRSQADRALYGKQTPEQWQESEKQRKITSKLIDEAQKDTERAAGIPDDITDQLQTSRNQKAAAAYEKRRAAGEDYKKGGKVKSSKPKCMARGGGCEVRGKTRGRMV